MNDNNTAQKWRTEMNRAEHESTYSTFLGCTKWTLIVVAGILLFLLFFVYD